MWLRRQPGRAPDFFIENPKEKRSEKTIMKKPKTPLIYRTPEQPIDTMESDQHARWEASQAAKQELVTILARLVLAAVEQGGKPE